MLYINKTKIQVIVLWRSKSFFPKIINQGLIFLSEKRY